MKRIIAIIAACLVIISVFASCSDPLSSSQSTESKASSESSSSEASEKETKPKAKKTYADSFNDVRNYMKDKGFLTDDIIKKANNTKLPKVDGVDYKYGYELIGAVKGEKYTNNTVVIELYEFKKGKQNDTIDSVKKNGTFTLYDDEITAYLTSDDKYMMIYSDRNVKDGDTSSDAYKTMQSAIKTFEAFKPTK